MTIANVQQELSDQALDIPDLEAVRAEANRRMALRIKHRRTRSLIAVAAAVVLMAGGASIAATVLATRGVGPAQPVAPRPVVQVPQVPLPADTQLVRHQLQPVTSPVTATTLPAGMTGMTWAAEPNLLGVVHYTPGSSPDSDDTSFGYLIGTVRDEPLFTSDGQPAVDVQEVTAQVSGHPAVTQSAAEGTVDALGLPAAKRLTWQLSNGSWIHVFVHHPSSATDLDAFAAGIVERPSTLSRTIGIGVSLPGLTSEGSINSDNGVFTGLNLCPPGVSPFSSPTAIRLISGYILGPRQCLNAFVARDAPDVSDAGPTVDLNVNGETVRVDPQAQIAWTRLDNGMTAFLRSRASTTLSAADLATAVASIRVAPSLSAAGASHPNTGTSAYPSPSVAASAPASGQDSAVYSQPARPVSALPTTPTQVPAATHTVPNGQTDLTVPFAVAHGAAQQLVWHWYSSPDDASVELTVGSDAQAVDVEVSYRASGLTDVPATAQQVQVGGHSAALWREASSATAPAQYLVGWVREDGAGITVRSADRQTAQTIAGLVTKDTTSTGGTWMPSVVLPGLVPTEMTAGPSSDDGLTLALCPPGTPAGEHATCVTVTAAPVETAPIASHLSSYRVASVDGQRVYVAPDGRTVARTVPEGSTRGTLLAVSAGSNVGPVTTGDLTAMLVTIVR